jgi:splicing suppressor protein 51
MTFGSFINTPKMRTSAHYTCQRCLSTFKSTPRAQQISRLSQRTQLGRRNLSTTQRQQTKLSSNDIKAQAARKTLGKRSLSSLGQQEQFSGNSYPEYTSPGEDRPLLKPNNLFHPFSSSPSPDIRRRAAYIKQHAYCPHPDHQQTRMPSNPEEPEARKSASGPLAPAHVKFECPDCGIPVSCSEEHWADDYEAHLEICDTLREINEDDHDLRSGRFFPEFEYPPPQIEEAMVNMTNWDTYMFSRDYKAINEERSMRQATRLLTYPVTVASVLHELSPYSIKKDGRLTVEGLKSLSGRLSKYWKIFTTNSF